MSPQDPAETARGPAEAVQEWFAGQPDLPCDRLDSGWLTVLAGEHKRTLPVFLEVGEHTLTLQAFFMTAPDENRDELYGYLLRRHLRSYVARFAIDASGDVILIAVVPVDAVSVQELDRIMGQLLQLADDTYFEAIRMGFRSYIEREQAWREKVGLSRNPIT